VWQNEGQALEGELAAGKKANKKSLSNEANQSTIIFRKVLRGVLDVVGPPNDPTSRMTTAFFWMHGMLVLLHALYVQERLVGPSMEPSIRFGM
jgi:hypothetical protein